MTLKFLAISMLVVIACASCGSTRQGDTAAVPEPRVITHGDLARTIVRLMGDESRMPARATALHYQAHLAARGIAPLGGWRYMEPVTEGDLAVVTVRLLRLQDRVQDLADEQSYVALLKSMDIEELVR